METLSSQRARALVNPDDGGRLVSLVLDGIELLGSAEVADGLPVGWFQGSFPMAPYAGRTKNGRFRFDGATYTVPSNAGPHAGHGLVFEPRTRCTPLTSRGYWRRSARATRH